jgi:hypothetical protein
MKSASGQGAVLHTDKVIVVGVDITDFSNILPEKIWLERRIPTGYTATPPDTSKSFVRQKGAVRPQKGRKVDIPFVEMSKTKAFNTNPR